MKLVSKISMSSRQLKYLALTCFALGSVTFIAAYIGMHWGAGIGQLNQPVLNFVLSVRNPILTTVAKLTTNIANPSTFVIVGIIVILWAIRSKEVYRPALLISAMGVAALVSTILKNLIMDPRPPISHMVPTFEMDYSFPSGHTIGIFVFLLALGYVIYSRHFTMKRLIVWLSTAFAGGVVIALTRLYLGYHWFTDTVASFGLGLVILSVLIVCDQLIQKRLSRPKASRPNTDQ